MNESEIENLLDQSLAATFPASDPVSVTQPGGGPEPWADRPDALGRLLGASPKPLSERQLRMQPHPGAA